MMLDGGSKATRAQGINPRPKLALIDCLEQILGHQLHWRRHLKSPWMPDYKLNMVAVQNHREEKREYMSYIEAKSL